MQIRSISIPGVFQKLVLDCVKAPAVEFPQVGLYCAHWKVGEFVNAEGGRFASEPAQVTIGKLEPGRVRCEDAPSAKAKPQLSSGSSIYLEHKTHLRESQPRGFDAVQDQLLKHSRYNSWECPQSIQQFFSGRISKDVGCIPFVGSVVGIGRFVFSIYQYATGAPNWTKDHFFEELKTSATEIFFLAPILRIYKLFFAASKTEMTENLRFSFDPILSGFFSSHTAQLIRFYTATPPSREQLSLYQTYQSPGTHSLQGQLLFNGADFYTRHGVMHASFVALFVPIFVSLYKNAGHPEAAALSHEDILDLQAVAFLHDFGRVFKGMDLVRDNEALEQISAEAAYQYMRQARCYPEERSRRLSHYIVNKDGPIRNKPLFQQILQSCDSLAVLRADDWNFDKGYLDLTRWIDANIPPGHRHNQAKEELNSVIDAAKQMLVNMGDSPYPMACHSQARRGQTIQGNFSLATKRSYEKSPHCYEMMQRQMQRHPELQRHL